MSEITWITFGAYTLLMLGIGYYAWSRTVDSKDYFLGGRSLGPWPTALSAGASDMSGWLLLGLPGYVYLSGFEAIWMAASLLVGTWLNWLLVASRLRVYTQAAGDAITLPEYFSNRFNDKSRSLQLISAVFVLIFFLFYTSSGLVAGGKLFETVFNIDYQWAVITGTLVIVGYTLFGGFLGVVWTDLVQSLLMAAALIIVPIAALQADHGVAQVFQSIDRINPDLLSPFTDNSGKALGLLGIISMAGWGLGYFGQPHILVRFAAIRDRKELPFARRIAVSWTAIALVLHPVNTSPILAR